MLYLIIAILLNVLISSIFKFFPRFSIDTLQAVVANYVVCVITGCVFIGGMPFTGASLHEAWFSWSLLGGSMFVGIFYLLAHCIRVDGLTTTTIANKLSLVIPVLFSVVLYHDRMGIGKIAGIALAFPAIYFTTRIKGGNSRPQNMLLPALIFIGGGLLDTLLKYAQATFLTTTSSQALFALYCFATAATTGVVIVAILMLLKKAVVQWRSIIAGIAVGIPNYFSIYYLIRMLNSNFLQSSAAIPVFNISVVVASAITAILLFREPAGKLRIIGLGLSLLAILLIAFGDR